MCAECVQIVYSGLPGAFRRLESRLGLERGDLRVAAIKGRLDADGHIWAEERDRPMKGPRRLENGAVWK